MSSSPKYSRYELSREVAARLAAEAKRQQEELKAAEVKAAQRRIAAKRAAVTAIANDLDHIAGLINEKRAKTDDFRRTATELRSKANSEDESVLLALHDEAKCRQKEARKEFADDANARFDDLSARLERLVAVAQETEEMERSLQEQATHPDEKVRGVLTDVTKRDAQTLIALEKRVGDLEQSLQERLDYLEVSRDLAALVSAFGATSLEAANFPAIESAVREIQKQMDEAVATRDSGQAATIARTLGQAVDEADLKRRSRIYVLEQLAKALVDFGLVADGVAVWGQAGHETVELAASWMSGRRMTVQIDETSAGPTLRYQVDGLPTAEEVAGETSCIDVETLLTDAHSMMSRAGINVGELDWPGKGPNRGPVESAGMSRENSL